MSRTYKISIAPGYEALRSFITSIPQLPANELGKVIYHIRNTVYRKQIGDYDIVIKQYRTPHIINRFVYAHLRKSKAERAYEYAQRLPAMGFLTPAPIATVCEYSCGMLCRSYFISEAIDATDADKLLARGGEDRRRAIDAMAKTLLQLKENGISHPDFNPRNVMLDSDYQPYLIDINRMRFGVHSAEAFRQHFKRIADDLDTTLAIARRYAEMAHVDADSTVATARKHWQHDHK